jgi:hypothetical protein
MSFAFKRRRMPMGAASELEEFDAAQWDAGATLRLMKLMMPSACPTEMIAQALLCPVAVEVGPLPTPAPVPLRPPETELPGPPQLASRSTRNATRRAENTRPVLHKFRGTRLS